MTEQATIEWSATLNVVSRATHPSKDLNGDKIILPQSALEQLLAASTSSPNPTSASSSSNPFRSPYTSTSASSSARAPYAFDGDPYQHLPSPLMFRLVNPSNGNAVYAGIREFSADEGEVLLSPYLAEALGFDLTKDTSGEEEDGLCSNGTTASRITVHAQHLPKGAYIRLRPLEAGYNPDDWKSLLERKLRESFTTLTNGAILSVPGVKGELFRLLVDRFRPEGDGICVVNTDLEVDIEALDEAQARETVRQIIARQQKAPGTVGGSSVGQELNIWKAVGGQVLPGDYVDYELPSWARSRVLEIEVSELQDEYGIDLFVSPKSSRQRAVPRQSEHVFGAFSYTEYGSKRIIIQPTNVELENAESLLISVFGYVPNSGASSTDALPLPYKLRIKNNAMTTEAPPASDSTTLEMQVSPDEEMCKNCLQPIPKRTIILHENFCLRNNIACAQCRNVFQKMSDEWREHWHCPRDEAYGSSEMTKAKHDSIYHTERRCPSCPFTSNSIPDIARHRTTLCPGKIILCQFCHLEVCQEGDPFNPSAEMLHTGLTEHELVDGARTTDCHLCSKIIRLRDMSTHLKYHELEKAHRPKPATCRNANCGRTLHGVGRNGTVNAGTRMGQGPGNDIGLCSLCFSPLYVSLYDPEGKALKRRIERRYLTQMMQGCGKSWCANEWCKTGRANLKLEPKPSTAQLALPQIRPLMDYVRDTQKSMNFCVDEANQRRRKLAEMLAAEDDWDIEWCIAACEAEGPNLDRARGWLINWAPSNE
ncbi:ubiquitin fusion degradation protein UFD1-domain-containing protein [Annulohypoxylon maeteangense]|uniref:ubiquitin fusion degradation protein UFD1-domain-containing protein n=1 Tax=Annulohypoxylon maeteangense TaxID=1927788 RepID=UPI002008C85C|nr:ubiquitin fusion degradation protein UFD1-domain-containing protein [Annulohypoxylon maeteangense]KAI0880013.1 ubiquitin fusion degradation protein UFD1-domain-containing protein [Annulohypoxylon maeteangense]